MSASIRWSDGGPVFSDTSLRWSGGGPAWLELSAHPDQEPSTTQAGKSFVEAKRRRFFVIEDGHVKAYDKAPTVSVDIAGSGGDYEQVVDPEAEMLGAESGQQQPAYQKQSPIASVSLADIARLSAAWNREREYREYLKAQDAQQLAAMYSFLMRRQDEEDIEFLLTQPGVL